MSWTNFIILPAAHSSVELNLLLNEAVGFWFYEYTRTARPSNAYYRSTIATVRPVHGGWHDRYILTLSWRCLNSTLSTIPPRRPYLASSTSRPSANTSIGGY